MTAIGLVDCNSFFCSCEQLFRGDLKGHPIVVLSNNDGCAVSRTPQAKALGIKVGDPFFQFRHLCHDKGLQVFSANFALYADVSKRVISTLKSSVPQIEVYSIDEAFLDMNGIAEAHIFGKNLKSKIELEIGIPVGVGIAPTKVLAKVANRLAKNSQKSQGVVNLMEKKFQDVALMRTPVEDLWGIGKASFLKLKDLGIKSAKDFRDYPHEKKIQNLLGVPGLNIKHELAGILKFPLQTEPQRAAKKEIMCSRSFAQEIYNLSELKEAIAHYVTEATEKMRQQGSLCNEITVFALPNPFSRELTHHEADPLYETLKLPIPTLDTFKLIHTAFNILDHHWNPRSGYKKAGVRLSGFYTALEYQLDLFMQGDDDERVALMKTVDRINSKEGILILKSAACGVLGREAKMNRQYKSPRYTTSWSELPVFE